MKLAIKLLFFLILAIKPALGLAQTAPSPFNKAVGDKDYKLEKQAVTLDYSDVDIIDAPAFGGLIIFPKDRWKNWVARGIYTTLVNILLLILIASFPKSSEVNIIISYLLTGSSFTVSIWISFFGLLLFRLNAFSAGIFFLPSALIFLGFGYFFLLKTKKSDISLAEFKESFRKMEKAAHEDPRLISVPGFPSDWPEEDFLK